MDYARGQIATLLVVIPCALLAAAPLPSDNCAAVQNAQERLSCYDSAAKQPKSESNQVNVEHDKAAIRADRNVSVEAGLVYRSGDVKPVARTDFYLLDDSLVEIFRNAGLRVPLNIDESGPHFQEHIYPRAIVMSFGKIHSQIDQFTADSAQARKMAAFHSQAIAAIAPHIIQKGTTGFSGRMKFASVKPGTYYLMGVYKTARGAAIWNLKTDVKDIETTVVLDQNNAASAD